MRSLIVASLALILSGAVALTAIPIWALTVTSFAGSGLAVDTPRGAWVAVYYWSFLAVLMLAGMLGAIYFARPED